ncbi:helix-turn-helix transcriptional regulator [Streptomyces olivaceiscleroticus]|uniref:HTH cro/C1-type domain-containing protein n=1 Tax=Streptomyces olivaceiscleroticus TaxID=68245 RepID=A0ABN1AQH4_9ACTN
MTNTHPGFEPLRDEAVVLRRAGLSRRQIRDRLNVDSDHLLTRLLEGEPPPEWTKRPNAKDGLRLKARSLREQGLTYDEIRAELGVSKSSISAWVRDLPKPAPRWKKVPQMERLERAQRAFRTDRDEERLRLTRDAAQEIADINDRELLLIGAALYWAEGSKDKAYARRESLTFINSDPRMIQVYVRWLELLDVERHRMRCSLHIHDSADLVEATEFWSELTGVPAGDFLKPSVRHDNPGTNRLNRGPSYRGCLRIYVTNSARLYQQVEGWWQGISGWAAGPTDDRLSGMV